MSDRGGELASGTRWVVIELRMHDNEPSVVDPDWQVPANRDGFAAALTGPHRLMAQSSGGRQHLTFCVTSDLPALLGAARRSAPARGVESVTALVWRVDPRRANTAARCLKLVGPQPRRPGLGPGYDEVLADLIRHAGRRSSPFAN